MIIGIDVGASTTKTVALEGLRTIGLASVETTDAEASASRALKELVTTMGRDLEDVAAVAVSGCGARRIGKELLGKSVRKVDEIRAIGVGGLALSGKREGLVVSMGTGTALVVAREEGKRVFHVGGTGVGGGTLLGLSARMLRTQSFEALEEMAAAGDTRKLDLTVADIAVGPIGVVPGWATASNLGRIRDDASENDVAAAIFNLVSQVIGMIAVFAARAYGLERDVVLVGGLARSPLITRSIREVTEMFHVELCVPQNSEYCVAIGAAKSAFNMKR